MIIGRRNVILAGVLPTPFEESWLRLKVSARFHSLTEMSPDRNGSDRNVPRSNRPDRKVAYPLKQHTGRRAVLTSLANFSAEVSTNTNSISGKALFPAVERRLPRFEEKHRRITWSLQRPKFKTSLWRQLAKLVRKQLLAHSAPNFAWCKCKIT